MRERSRWVLVIAVPCLLGTSGVAPAVARDGVNTSGTSGFALGVNMHVPQAPRTSGVIAPRLMARHIGVQDGLRLHHPAQPQIGLPVMVWPYSSFVDTAPIAASPVEASPVENEVSLNPYVIVISDLRSRAPQHAAPDTPPDYSYAGCYAIPNGYRCDISHRGAAP